MLPTEEEAEAFSYDEFVNRVAQRSGRDTEAAEAALDAVMATIRDAVTPGEFEDLLSQLPTEFQGWARDDPAGARVALQRRPRVMHLALS